MAEKLTVVARVRAKPGKVTDVKQALLALVEWTRTEPGCISYDLYQSQNDEAQFLFHENWESKEDLDVHAQSPHIQAFRARAGELLAEPVEIKFFRMVSQP